MNSINSKNILFQIKKADFIAVFCIITLIYFSNGFEIIPRSFDGSVSITKRYIQLALSIPLLIIVFRIFFLKFNSFFHPLIYFTIFKIIVDIYSGQKNVFIFEGMLVVVALTVLNSLSKEYIILSIKLMIIYVTVFTFLASFKVLASILFPQFLSVPFFESLGYSLEKIYIFNISFQRSSSFAMEPSLNVLFFLLPSILSILNSQNLRYKPFILTLSFCIISFSTSVFVAVIVAIISYFLLRVVNIRIKALIPWGILVAMLVYIGILMSISNFENASAYFDFGGTNEILNKSVSFQVRAKLAAANILTFINYPLGIGFNNVIAINIPNPLLITAGISAGWVGTLFYLIFLVGLCNRVAKLWEDNKKNIEIAVGISLLIGSLFVFIVFNDYLMSNYAGLVSLLLVDRYLKFNFETDVNP